MFPVNWLYLSKQHASRSHGINSFLLSLPHYIIYIIIDRKNCEGLLEKPIDLAYNAASFVWNPEKGAKVRLINLFIIN